jgi:hypothetical protein
LSNPLLIGLENSVQDKIKAIREEMKDNNPSNGEDRVIEIGEELGIGDLKVLAGFGRNSTHKGLQPMAVGEEITLDNYKTKTSIGRWQKLEDAPRPGGGRPMQMFKKVAD